MPELNAPADLQFTIDSAPQGFLIDADDGYVQGTPTKLGSYNMTLFAVGSRNQKAEVESLQLTIKEKDINGQTNGPNNQGYGVNGKRGPGTINPVLDISTRKSISPLKRAGRGMVTAAAFTSAPPPVTTSDSGTSHRSQTSVKRGSLSV